MILTASIAIIAALAFLVVGIVIGKRMAEQSTEDKIRAIQQADESKISLIQQADENKIRLAQHAAEDKIPEIRKEAKQEALRHSRAGLGGIVSEEIAPLLHDFPGKASEARFIGKPIDYLIFKGMDEKNITEVIFVEVKSGTSRLDEDERTLKDAINAKNVRWVEFHVPDGMMKREETMPVPVPQDRVEMQT